MNNERENSTFPLPTISVLKGTSGIHYHFLLYLLSDYEEEGKSGEGVYIYLKRVGISHNYTFIYVGETNDLLSRISEHECDLSVKRDEYDYIAILEEKSRERRLLIESDLISIYRPKNNKETFTQQDLRLPD